MNKYLFVFVSLFLGCTTFRPVPEAKLDAYPVLAEDQLPNVVHLKTVDGKVTLDVSRIELHYEHGQEYGRGLDGFELKRRLASQSVYGADALDYLLAHTDLVPKSWGGWTGKHNINVCFWGTIYTANGGKYVRCLERETLGSSNVHASWRWLDEDSGWDEGNLAAIRIGAGE